MADSTENTAGSAAGNVPLLNLKVLSPSTEVNGDIHFPQLPATTTVAGLKLKIQETLATHPQPERQRLIYRGRVMAKETDTMLDIFGRDSVCRWRTSRARVGTIAVG